MSDAKPLTDEERAESLKDAKYILASGHWTVPVLEHAKSAVRYEATLAEREERIVELSDENHQQELVIRAHNLYERVQYEREKHGEDSEQYHKAHRAWVRANNDIYGRERGDIE